MSENRCTQPECERPRFEDKIKCIFHCEKDDWFEVDKISRGGVRRDWRKNQNKINRFWTVEKVPVLLAISLNIVVALLVEGFNWEGYGDNWIMLLTNLFRPFYGWNEPPSSHGLSDYLIGLLHLTLMYSAFALLLFAIRRRFKME